MGAIIRRKGIDVLINALKRLPKESIKDWKLIIAGEVVDEEYLKEIRKISNGLNVEFRINVSDCESKELYPRSSIFILPSGAESFGIARLEAVAIHLAVVTTDTPCRDDLEDMGFTEFEKGKVDQLKDILYKLLTNEEYRKRIPNSYRIYSRREIAKQYLDLFMK